MKETIDRIQDWYKINCNGDWEHSYGYKIETLDNPGWAIKIDLSETSLDKLEFKREFRNPKNENDWFNIHTENQTLIIYCGPENMKTTFEIFFDELIPKYSDKDFIYEIYLPLEGKEIEIWVPAKSTLIDEKTVQITEIEKVEYKKIKVRDVEKINFNQADLENLKINYSVGDILEVELENVYDGIILTTNNKKEN
jgi:hypothetical protein